MSVRAIKPLTILVLTLLTLAAVGIAVSDDGDGASVGTLTLEPNYPSGSGTAKTMTLISGMTIELPTRTFSCDGYVLTGWSASKTSSTSTYEAGSDYTMPSYSVTLYAVWQKITVANAVHDSAAPSTGSVDAVYSYVPVRNGSAESDFWKVFSEANFSNTYGYSVVAKPDWLSLTISNRTVTFSGSPDSPGNCYVEIECRTGGSSYYGWWVINVPSSSDSDRTLTFDMDGGTGSINSVKAPVGTATVLPNHTDSSGKQISKDGCTLVGWEIPDGRGSSSVYALGAFYTIAFDATVEAKWVADPDVLVYSLDGGSLENVAAYVVHDGRTVTLRTDGVTKDGYRFIGWRPSQDRDVAYAPGLNLTVSGSMYMEAYFVPAGTDLCTVTYDANGGQGIVSSQKVESGCHVKLPTALNMVRDGFTFVGWSESKDGDVWGYEDYEVNSDVRLYAVWQENGSSEPDDPSYYDVSFSTNGGVGNYEVQRIASGGNVVRPVDPTMDGYVFLGWRSLTQTGLWDFSSDTVQSDTILQAQWAQHFTVTVDGLTVIVQMKGGYYDMAFDVYWGDQDFNTSGKESSDAIGVSVGKASHTYEYTSYGHITVRSHDSKGYYESRMPYSVQGEHYNPRVDWIVTFDPNNGGAFSEQIVDAGGTATEPTEPVWEGHTFNGWYFEGKKWDFSTVVTQDMKLVGGWDDVVPDDDDDTPTAIRPKASFTIAETDGGWKLDASGSTNAASYRWTLDGTDIGTGKTTVLKSEGLSEGNHAVTLVVTSSTGHTDSDTKTIAVSGDSEPEPKGSTNWVLIGAVAVLIIIAIVVVRFWI